MDRGILLNQFNLSVVFFLRIESDYNYTRDYVETVARNSPKSIPATLSIRKAKTR